MRRAELKVPVWCTDTYVQLSDLHINREGFFSLIWNRLEGETSEKAEHEMLARWDERQIGKKYFRINSLSKNIQIDEELIVIVLDSRLCPLYLVEDCLKNHFGKGKKLHGKARTLLEFNHLEQTDPVYINQVYQLFHKYLRCIPDLIKLPDLIKRSSLRNLRFHLIGTEWLFADPWIAHLLLAKGASWARSWKEIPLVNSRHIQLSDFHEIEIGELPQEHTREFSCDEIKTMYTLNKSAVTVTNVLKIPDSFLLFSYKNIY